MTLTYLEHLVAETAAEVSLIYFLPWPEILKFNIFQSIYH
jgi:hypothetical protein